jgi:hypothetical protein
MRAYTDRHRNEMMKGRNGTMNEIETRRRNRSRRNEAAVRVTRKGRVK